MANESGTVNEDNVTQREKNLFYTLIVMLRTGVYQQLGLIENPVTKEKKKNIKVARESIDMLNMLLRRMRLTKEEEDTLKNVLTELQNLFIKESETKL